MIKLICLNPLFWGKFRLQSLVALHKISLKNSSVKNIFRTRLNYCHSLYLVFVSGLFSPLLIEQWFPQIKVWIAIPLMAPWFWKSFSVILKNQQLRSCKEIHGEIVTFRWDGGFLNPHFFYFAFLFQKTGLFVAFHTYSPC